jgi:hypothetical protein
MTVMLRRALPVIACLGISFAFVAPLHAQEGEEDLSDLSFEQKLIHQFMTAMGAKSGREVGIDYRERSPLVLPPDMTLPEPQANNAAALAPNWPKDPDEQARRDAAIAAKAGRPSPEEQRRQLLPSELAKGRTSANRNNPQPGETPVANRQLSPSELGYRGGLFGNILTPMKEETAKFEGEPTRKTLTAPPVGYQTPSPNYSYGIAVKEKQEVDPSRQLPPGKF